MAVKYLLVVVLVVLYGDGYCTIIKPRPRVPIKYVEYYTEQKQEIEIPIMIHLDKAMTRQVPKIKGSRRKLKLAPKKILKEVEEVFNDVSLDQRVRLKLVNVKTVGNKTVAVDENVSNYLKNYCEWQKSVKEKNGEPYFSVLLTGVDTYYIGRNGKKVRENTGRGYMSKMCSMNKSCAVIKWHKTDLVYLLAHEIAHSLGVPHDGYRNSCRSGFIMTTQYQRRNMPQKWSSCSKTFLQKFLSASGMFCETRTDCFHAIMRKRVASLMRRLRGSPNSLLQTVAGRLDGPFLQHWDMLHRGSH